MSHFGPKTAMSYGPDPVLECGRLGEKLYYCTEIAPWSFALGEKQPLQERVIF